MLKFLPLILLAAASCAQRAEVLLPIHASVREAAMVERVTVQLRTRAPEGTREKLQAAIASEAKRAGLVSGRAIALLVEVDKFNVAAAGEAMFGAADRLAGSVYVRDAETGEALGQLYLDLDRKTPGLAGLLLRGGSIDDQLVAAFASRVAQALGGRSSALR